MMPLRIKIIECSAAERIEQYLNGVGVDFVSTRVDELDVESPDPDIVLYGSDSLPGLQRVKQTFPQAPVILVIAESPVNDFNMLLESGVSDYVTLSDLPRLPFAIGRALAATHSRLAERELDSGEKLGTEQADDALRVSHSLLSSIVENAPVRIFWKDANLSYLGCNSAFACDAGMEKPEDLVGKDDYQMAWHDQAELYRDDDRRVMVSGMARLDYEEPQTGPDGKAVWLRTSKVPLRDATGKILGVLGIYEDITERKLAEQTQKKLTRALALIRQSNSTLIYATDEQLLLEKVCRLAVEAGGYLMAWVGLPEGDQKKSIRPVAQSGFEEGYLENAHISWDDSDRGRGPTGTAIRTGTIQVNQNFLSNPAMAPWRESALKHGYQSSIALPLVDSGKVLGSLTLYAREPDAFIPEETDLLAELASDLAFGIAHLRMQKERDLAVMDNQKHMEKLRKSLEDALQAIAATVEMRDPYTAGHQRRVAHLAVATARELGLSEEQVHGVHLSAIVHDIGKIHIPSELLSKPGRLSEIEYSLIKVHPEAGYEILKEIDFPWPIALAVLQHHERMDGSGYPQGLMDKDIILESRILSVADVVEAISSHRPYRAGLGIEAALEELEKNRGILYDPVVADACIRLFREKGFRLPAV